MSTVRGSKQVDMVVVPHRPWQRLLVVVLGVVTLVVFTWSAYDYGLNRGISTGATAVRERDQLRRQVRQNNRLIQDQQQKIADLKLGNQVDTRANEDVRKTIAALQSKVADQGEQISFYKAVMSPNETKKGLRIYRLNLKTTSQPGRYHYNLLLTHIVDRHSYIEGSVKMRVVGTKGGAQESIPVAKLSDDSPDNYNFRFRYFQNIGGDLTIPSGFKPRQFIVVARATGRDGTRLEKKFQWDTIEG